MVNVSAVNQQFSLPTNKEQIKAGAKYELYIVRQARFGGVWFTGILFLAVLVFLIYAVNSPVPNLWIYATAAAAATLFLFTVVCILSLSQVYDRISLLSPFGQALACQHCLLVITKSKGNREAWFATGLSVFKQAHDINIFASGELVRCDNAFGVSVKQKKISRQFVSATRNRSFVQTDSVDLKDHFLATAVQSREMLLKKAGFKVRRG